MKLTVAGKTDKGMVRQNNEDSYLIDEEIGLAVVADGAGGQASGEVASHIAVDVIKERMRGTLLEDKKVILGKYNPQFSERANELASSIRFANQVVYEASKKYPQNSGMATTCVAIVVNGKNCSYCHVGDSRLYLIRNNEVKLLTADHSLVEEQLRRGLITKEQAEKSEYKNLLLRALGTSPEVDVDINEMQLQENDRFLLCSDGLTHVAKEELIFDIIKNGEDLAEMCGQLVTLANNSGGNDNITVVMAQTGKDENLINKLFSLIKVKYGN